MDLRLELYELASRHGLGAAATSQLERDAGIGAEPPRLRRHVALALAVLAAILLGLGLVFWVAAHWDTLGRIGRFALLQATLAVMAVAAALRPAARLPLSLLVWLGTGALLAYFGQTYQTGADAWQLFALWSLLMLPLALGARSDLLWAPWALVAMTAVALWVQAHTGQRWRAEASDLPVLAVGWTLALGVVVLLSAPARPRTGAGPWAGRVALTLAVLMITLAALAGLFQPRVAAHFVLGLLLLAALAAALGWGPLRSPDAFGLSVTALGVDALLIAGLGRWIFEDARDRGSPLDHFLLLGLLAAALIGVTVSLVQRRQRALDASAGQAPMAAGQPPLATPAAGAPPATTARPLADAPLDRALRRALRRGVLPAGTAVVATPPGRPWPVVLLMAAGAWMTALPLLAVVVLLLGERLQGGPGPFVAGLLLGAGALFTLRSRGLPVFAEQLALPALLTGLLALGIGLFRDLDAAAAAAGLGLACLLLSAAVPPPWLRALLGCAAAAGFGLAWAPRAVLQLQDTGDLRIGIALHALLAAWLAALALQPRMAPRPRAWLESVQAGWLLLTLAGLAAWSGMTMLVGASLGGDFGAGLSHLPWHPGQAGALPLRVLTLALSLAAAAWTARRWPALRAAWCAAAALLLAALALAMPPLAAAGLALAVTATSSRPRLALAAAVAAAWMLGAFYLSLGLPLQTKALVLVLTGALLGAVAVWGRRLLDRRARPAEAPTGRGALAGLALSAGATLAVVNAGIWQKQALIAAGQPVFVALAPADPRSLMQGDYMALRFALPAVIEPAAGVLGPARPRVAARRDARGIATLRPLPPGAAPEAGEIAIELTARRGEWTLVSDAWFFAEGEAERWQAARYGEFRVDGSGRALLVGLRGSDLRVLR